MGNRFQDLTGRTFGNLRVIRQGGWYESTVKGGRYAGQTRRHARWLCLCKCGEETTVVAYSLKSGCAKSCGKNGCRPPGHDQPMTYFFEDRGYIKAGKSNRAQIVDRLREHQISSPLEINVLKVVEGNIEQFFLKKFDQYRLKRYVNGYPRGEWVAPFQEVLDFIESLEAVAYE